MKHLCLALALVFTQPIHATEKSCQKALDACLAYSTELEAANAMLKRQVADAQELAAKASADPLIPAWVIVLGSGIAGAVVYRVLAR